MADLATALRDFNKERKFSRKGPLCVALVITQHARKMGLAAGGTGAAPPPPPVPTGKANPAGTRATATAEGKGATVAGAGALGAACTEAAQQIAPLSDALEVAKWIFLALTLAGIGFGLLATVRRIREGNA